MLFQLLLGIHLLLCVSLIVLVLLQQGKGADMGAAFGGGSNTLFGAAGATAFITKLTTGIAISFMVTSILLVNMYTTHVREGVGVTPDAGRLSDVLGGAEAPQETAPQAAPAPAAPAPNAAPANPKPEAK